MGPAPNPLKSLGTPLRKEVHPLCLSRDSSPPSRKVSWPFRNVHREPQSQKPCWRNRRPEGSTLVCVLHTHLEPSTPRTPTGISLAYLRPVDARFGDVCKENLSSFTPPSGLVTNSRRSISTPSNLKKPKKCSANSWNLLKSCTSFSATDLGWMRVFDEITGISLIGVNPSLGGGALFLKVSSPSGASFFSASLAEGSCECFGGLAGFEKPETGGISIFSTAAFWGVNLPFWPPWDSTHGGKELPTPKASVLVDFLEPAQSLHPLRWQRSSRPLDHSKEGPDWMPSSLLACRPSHACPPRLT